VKSSKLQAPSSKLILLIFILFLLSGCNSPNKPAITPRSEIIDPYSWDFGRVKEGVILEHSFVLKNESKVTLNIKDINTSCGCTVSKVQKKVLLPGEATLIEVNFNTKGYSAKVQQFINVHTDNLDNPILRFIIKAQVQR